MWLLSLSGRREASPLTFGHPTVRSLIRAVSLCGMGLRSVHSHLNLPTKLPIQLSFADQVRFVAETIRRLDATNKFANVSYGWLEEFRKNNND